MEGFQDSAGVGGEVPEFHQECSFDGQRSGRTSGLPEGVADALFIVRFSPVSLWPGAVPESTDTPLRKTYPARSKMAAPIF
jgi:hypothetical protein